MYTRVPAEKKPNPSFGGSSTNSNKKPLNRQRPAKKPNVRSTDYRILMQWILTNPDSITQEEFMFFQSAVGYQKALRVMEEGRRRKQLQKLGVPAAGASKQPIQTNKQAGENTPSGDGLPENLKTGLENLSGVSLSDVKVHKNSEEPEKVGAQAYTQGTDIHIAPGQEKYLPHEGWHAVQQKQGRVEAEIQLKTGAAVNEDSKLEREADVMGARAEKEGSGSGAIQSQPASDHNSPKINANVIQRVTLQEGMELNNTKNPVKEEADGIKTAGYGETSENVKKIQQVLIRMNYWTGKSGDKATGYFGEVTKESLINFQTGYMKLGKGELYDKKGNYVGCGPRTAESLDSLYKLLNNSSVPEQAKSSIMGIGKNKEANAAYDWDIKAGQYNGYVKEAQLILMNLGYKLPKYGADGKWSSSGETYEAILSYQTNCENAFNGVDKNGSTEGKKLVEYLQGIKPTGKLDKRTYEALEKEKSKKAVTNSNKSPAMKTEKDDKGTGKAANIKLTRGDLIFLYNNDFINEFLIEQKAAVMLKLKINGTISGDDLVNIGIMQRKEYKGLKGWFEKTFDTSNPDNMASLLETSYRLNQYGTSFIQLEFEEQQKRQAEVQSLIYFMAANVAISGGRNSYDNVPEPEFKGFNFKGAGKATGQYSGKLVQVNKADAAADALASRLGGQSRVKFANDSVGREFDAVSDAYIAQTKPALQTVNQSVRNQMKATFEAAQETGRKVYYHFEGQPAQSVINKLNEYSQRYGIDVIIDTNPLMK